MLPESAPQLSVRRTHDFVLKIARQRNFVQWSTEHGTETGVFIYYFYLDLHIQPTSNPFHFLSNETTRSRGVTRCCYFAVAELNCANCNRYLMIFLDKAVLISRSQRCHHHVQVYWDNTSITPSKSLDMHLLEKLFRRKLPRTSPLHVLRPRVNWFGSCNR